MIPIVDATTGFGRLPRDNPPTAGRPTSPRLRSRDRTATPLLASCNTPPGCRASDPSHKAGSAETNIVRGENRSTVRVAVDSTDGSPVIRFCYSVFCEYVHLSTWAVQILEAIIRGVKFLQSRMRLSPFIETVQLDEERRKIPQQSGTHSLEHGRFQSFHVHHHEVNSLLQLGSVIIQTDSLDVQDRLAMYQRRSVCQSIRIIRPQARRS